MKIGNRAVHSFRTTDDITSALSAVLDAFPGLCGADVAILELMVNAVEHGNLDISFKEKTALLENDGVADEIKKRLADDKYKSRSAILEVQELGDEIVVMVSDEGKGFNWKSYLDADIPSAHKLHGRGIPLSLAFCKTLTYIGNGNKVVAVFEPADTGSNIASED
jgi:hypothetical protein